MKDLPQASQNRFITYTDDTKLFFSENKPVWCESRWCSPEIVYKNIIALLNIDLYKIDEYLQINKLSLNFKESKYQLFGKINV